MQAGISIRAIAYEKSGRWFTTEEPFLRAKERTDAGSSAFRHPRSELIAPLPQEVEPAFNNRKLYMRLPCHNVPIRFRSFRFRARFLGSLKVRAVWISLRVKGRWTKNRLLLSTDPTMPPEAIIRLYADRWTIEPMFNSLKHAEGAKELWQRSKEVFHRWLHLAGMALTVMLSLRDDPDIVRLAHPGAARFIRRPA